MLAIWRTCGQKRHGMSDSPEKSPLDQLGERLRVVRAASKQKQAVVAAAVGVDVGTYSRWERGEKIPRAAEIARLARHFAVTTDHLLLGEPMPNEAIPLELHVFLNTPMGKYADAHNLVPMLRDTKWPFPPTVKTYRRFVKTWRLVNDDEADDGGSGDTRKKPRS